MKKHSKYEKAFKQLSRKNLISGFYGGWTYASEHNGYCKEPPNNKCGADKPGPFHDH